MIWFQSTRAPRLQERVASVGRMALTAYLGTSVICVALFDGTGLYGSLQRYQLYAVVAVVWGFWLVICPWWLGRFRFGPAEWLWRSLTYVRIQPFRIAGPPVGTE
jgi:uncharacterized protein